MSVSHSNEESENHSLTAIRKANMGTHLSRRDPDKELAEEWRKTDWSKQNRDNMVETLRNFNLNDPNMGQIRCLLLGPVGAGKSSFIKSVNNVFQGRTSHSALAGSAKKSNTKTYNTHYIQNGTNRLPFAFNDVMGLETQNGCGIHPDDLISALKGHIPEGYKFNPVTPFTDVNPDYNQEPNIQDKVQCLVNVISLNEISVMTKEVINKLEMIQEIANELGIPQVVVMTMPDKACQLVKTDVKNMYTSIAIQNNMQKCSNELGVSMDCILPVKNYHEENELNNDMDILILNAITQIVNYANDYVWMLQQKKSSYQ
ncbi:hypothetical protein DPEC_G00213320 [Dallia pectoralis]|uniref:Uncharacterized protein n=1 Tax=Dallia pectoralis TaxID=75939 RepID=A0ACC2G646_DALPE|nr:hypothetical protein DPEC_G00213320 [Dallia pectoralis]